MDNKVKKSEIPTDFFCNICNKFYASQNSLCNHKKKYHTTSNVIPNPQNVIPLEAQNIIIKNSLSCEYCNKVFATRQSKSKHKIKSCKSKNNIINNTTEIHSKTLQINNTSNNDIVINNKIIKSNDHNFFVDLNKNFMTFNDKPIKFFYYNDQIFFKGIDIALMLDYIDTDQAIRKNVDDEDIIIIGELLKDPVSQTGLLKSELLKKDNLKTIYINESGFYTIILKSKKDEAKKFRRWVTSEVLPSIRKYGSYSIINNYVEEDLDKYYGIDCVYIIHIKDDIYKYGNTSHLFKRLQAHKTNFDYKKIIKIYEMKNINDAIKLEKKIIKLTKSLNINIIYNLGNTNHKEMFKVNNNDLDNVIKKIDDFSLDINNKVLDYGNQLKIEELKTKQLELEYKTIQLKLELLKLSSINP